jgi:hypothetical protein
VRLTDAQIAAPEFQAFARAAFEDAFNGEDDRALTFDLGLDTPGGDVLHFTTRTPSTVSIVDGALEIGSCTFASSTATPWPSGPVDVDVLLARHQAFQRFDGNATLPVAVRLRVVPAARPVRFVAARGEGRTEPAGTYTTTAVRIDGGAMVFAPKGHEAAMQALMARHGVHEPPDLLAIAEARCSVVDRSPYGEAWQVGEQRIVIVRSGLGDGTYPIFVGLDDNDAICRVVADFALLG